MLKGKWTLGWLKEAREYLKIYNTKEMLTRTYIPETDRKMHDIGVDAIDMVLEFFENPQWLKFKDFPMFVENRLYYCVVECKNLFRADGYRKTKILRLTKEHNRYLWIEEHNKKVLDEKYQVVAYYPIPDGLAREK